jgi:DNA recombination protein RmuC
MEAYLDAHDAQDAARAPLLEQHAAAVERHFRGLARKEYWKQFPRAPKLVVMFMPLESALVAALEKKPHLHEEAMRNNVLIATPMLLVALLRAVAYGWQQESVAENARAIADAGSELYERLARFVERLSTVGERLGQASRSYNDAVGSLESRLLPSARRLHELKATRRDAIKSPTPIHVEPRSITQTELIGCETAEAVTNAETGTDTSLDSSAEANANPEPPAVTKLRPTPDRSCAAP